MRLLAGGFVSPVRAEKKNARPFDVHASRNQGTPTPLVVYVGRLRNVLGERQKRADLATASTWQGNRRHCIKVRET